MEEINLSELKTTEDAIKLLQVKTITELKRIAIKHRLSIPSSVKTKKEIIEFIVRNTVEHKINSEVILNHKWEKKKSYYDLRDVFKKQFKGLEKW